MGRRILRIENGRYEVALAGRFSLEEELHNAIEAHPEILPNEDFALGPLITIASNLSLPGAGEVFVVLGNSSSGGAVAPPLLPRPFALISQWLPSGATVSALRSAIYFPDYQHLRPLAVLAVWAIGLFVAMIVAMRHGGGTALKGAAG